MLLMSVTINSTLRYRANCNRHEIPAPRLRRTRAPAAGEEGLYSRGADERIRHEGQNDRLARPRAASVSHQLFPSGPLLRAQTRVRIRSRWSVVASACLVLNVWNALGDRSGIHRSSQSGLYRG